MVDNPENVHYREGAKREPAREASEMPAKRVSTAADHQDVEGSGPGEVKRNVTPARPRQSAFDRRHDEG